MGYLICKNLFIISQDIYKNLKKYLVDVFQNYEKVNLGLI